MATFSKTLRRSRALARYNVHRLRDNRASRRALERDAPSLRCVQADVLRELYSEGLAIVSFDDLIGDRGLWRELSDDVNSFVVDAERISAKKRRVGKRSKAIRATETGKRHPFPSEHWLSYALSDEVLGLVNAYLRMRAKLTYMDIWYSPASPADAPRISAQRWHRDPEDRRLVKIFTYFSDVDERAGALEYVRGSVPGGRYGKLWPWHPASEREGERYPPEGELESSVSDQDLVVASGPPGTIVFCDTAGFHRGGFGSRPRVVAPFTYVSPASIAASLTSRRVKTRDVPEALSPAGRFALS